MKNSERRASTREFVVVATFVLAVLFVTQVYVWVGLWPSPVPITWTEAMVASLPNLMVWGLSIPIVIWLADRFPVTPANASKRLILHLVLSFVVSFLALGALELSDDLLHWSTLLGLPGNLITQLVSEFRFTVLHLHMGVAIYWMVLAGRQTTGLYALLQENRLRTADTEAKLARTQLDTLRSQLQPHFLFNTLNSVAVLIRKDPNEAEVMLHRVSDLLRASLSTTGAHELPLREELELVETYLEIERTRFKDRLTVEFDIEDDTRGARVPNLVLQPLVENAVKHGIAPRAEGGHIRIGAHRRNGRLVLEVSDDGVGFSRGAATRGTGVGLTNTRRRLATMYQDDQSVEILEPGEGGTCVRVSLPYRATSEPDGDAS